MLLFSVFAGTAAGAHDPKNPDHDKIVHAPISDENIDIKQDFEGTDEAAATRVRNAFFHAKKAFHESRQEIQAIKKLEESPAKDVPTFFGGDDEGDEDANDDGEYHDGSDPELST